MSLRNLALVDGSLITLDETAGSPITLKADAQNVPNGLHLVVVDDPDVTTRRQLVAKVRPSTYDPKTQTFSKDKKSLTLVAPCMTASGKTVYNTVRLEVECHPEYQYDGKNLRNLMFNLASREALNDFWTFGTFE